jgi:hypothetical protein
VNEYDQKLAATVALLKETKGLDVLVKRRKLTDCLHIGAPGIRDTYETSIMPLIRFRFPEAHMTSSWFTPEPWASDPWIKVSISLDTSEQSMSDDYDQKVEDTVERLRQKGARVRVKRRKLSHRKKTYLNIVAEGTHHTFMAIVMPSIRKDFPEAYMTSGGFMSFDTSMNITVSLDPRTL